MNTRELKRWWVKRGALNLSKRADFYADMSAFATAGIPPKTTLERMLMVANRRKRLRSLAIVLRDMLRRLDAGSSLAGAVGAWVPPIEAAMIRSGESTGDLPRAFAELAENVGTQARIRAKIKADLTPQAVAVVVLFALIYFVLSTVVPEAKKLIPPSLIQQMMLAPWYFAIGDFILGAGPWLIPAGAGLAWGAWWSLDRWTGPLRAKVEARVPPWSLFRWIQSSFFLASMSAMLRAGMTFQTAVVDMAKIAAPWHRKHYRTMLNYLSQGKAEVQSLDTGFLPPELSDRLLIYASLPSFTEVMHSLSKDAIVIFERKIGVMVGTIKTTVMLTVAVFIVFTIFSLGEIALMVEQASSRASQSITG